MKVQVLDRFTANDLNVLTLQGTTNFGNTTLMNADGAKVKVLSQNMPSMEAEKMKIAMVVVDSPISGDELELVELN